MKTPPSEQVMATGGPLPRVLSEEHRRRLAAVRNAAAETLASAEELVALLAPKPYHYEDEDYEAARAQHARRLDLLANLRMELEHESDLIEFAEVQAW